jgi:hypothetical protein
MDWRSFLQVQRLSVLAIELKIKLRFYQEIIVAPTPIKAQTFLPTKWRCTP